MELNRPKRVFYSKVRTGCLTCKIRKVKCDEAKPRCHRCVSTGRDCDGYRPPGTHARQSSATPSTLASHSGLFASAAERRSFYYFQAHACKPLAGYFNTSFWGLEIMLAAVHYEPIRHLVIALGAAYESFEDSPPETASPRELGLPHREKAANDSEHGMQFALQQCNQSIKQLASLSSQVPSRYKSAEATCCVLTASVLFIYLASVRGHMAEAIQHIQSAVKVLRSFEQSQVADRNRLTPSKSPIFPVPVSQLRTALTSMYGQLRVMKNDVFLQEFQSGAEDILVSEVKPATVFLSVPEAHIYVERLFHNTHAFLQQTELNPPGGTDTEALGAVVARHKELCRALDSSWNALDMLSSSLNSSLGATDRERQTDSDGLVVLRLYHLLLAVRLRIDVFRPDKRESAFDELEAHLKEMLECCEILVENQTRQKETRSQQPSCSSGLGYVMPLHMIAARCRNPQLRRRALRLLLDGSRREGIWDSRLAGRIASQTLAIEEEAKDTVPEADRRVREVKVQLQGERKARLRFVTVADWKQGHPGAEKVIDW
ncbi:hypothetical protein CONLIGDRAFT_635274 [Coniochaeta ligniaria NRRL 30616]|uniref:Zn(2)-C6 fungal-type domain-containing protein n=1 Tax=Coniochaeta ligniaria NRRL 30616 TaxID=1408157 RepID=A0A1J7JBC3_9PEZI|nr:hypothetical protein CONLIGDRAFT_635274 [Coniochaeta ligniaria NRRL 30616]